MHANRNGMDRGIECKKERKKGMGSTKRAVTAHTHTHTHTHTRHADQNVINLFHECPIQPVGEQILLGGWNAADAILDRSNTGGMYRGFQLGQDTLLSSQEQVVLHGCLNGEE
jgi:hypothetical protein